MKKADNFDASKWLVENKITFQSRLNEYGSDYDKVEQLGKKAVEDYVSSNNLGTISSIISLGAAYSPDYTEFRFEVTLAPTGKTLDITVQYDTNYNLTDLKINKSKSTNSDEEFIDIEYPSGDYSGEIENGKVTFLLIDDSIEDEYEDGFYALEGDENIMDYLGKNHFFTKLYNTIGGTFNVESDAVGITVDLNDLKSRFGKYIVSEADGSLLNEEESIVDFKKWKSILMPFYKEVIKEINQPDMSLNIYSRWVGDFIRDCNTYTSYDNLIKSGFNGQDIKTDEDLKNQLVKWIERYI